ncbi:MAG: hypothetical protein D6798_17275 [Deltaproteobacteria bacterium]|nr:MAG: hypothetical protein D6798_17275 [Deltaproteobacteria bacterium]
MDQQDGRTGRRVAAEVHEGPVGGLDVGVDGGGGLLGTGGGRPGPRGAAPDEEQQQQQER